MGGFTLVEMVTVMIVLGILSIGSVHFISDSSNGFSSTMERTALAEEGRFAVNRLTRELRSALPESVRVNAFCVEFLAVQGASHYLSLPVAMPASSMTAAALDSIPVVGSLRAVVNPEPDMYQLANPGSISPTVTITAPDADNQIEIQFETAFQFVNESAKSRVFFVSSPRSYCIHEERLWRYDNYDYHSNQPTIVDLPSTLPQRTLMLNGVEASFQVTGASLNRGQLIELNLDVYRGSDRISLSHQVQVRNVP